MFESQADAVLEQAIPVVDSLVEDYEITWDRPVEEYPEVMLPLIYVVISEEALKWIDSHCPRAWFRPLFAGEDELVEKTANNDS
jgi:hypothetical protein